MMDKILFVTTCEKADVFQRRLRDGISVIGVYSTTSDIERVQQHVHLIGMEELSMRLAEPHVYVAIDSEATRKTVLKMGARKEQIINIDRFADTTYDNPLNGISSEYNGLLMGMSHSQCAINTESFGKMKYFKMSSPSLDMFLHYHFLKKLILDHSETLVNIEKIILELPYYIFNYDLSRFGDFVYTKMKYFNLVEDYHHLKGLAQINEYRSFVRMFDKPLITMSNPTPIKAILKKLGLYGMRTCYRAIMNKDKVWTSYYEDTVRENVRYWREFKNLISTYIPKAELTVLVMPMNSVFRKTHAKSIAFQKDLFYAHMGGVFLIDDFELFNNPFLYSDHCHLNIKGAGLYNKHIELSPDYIGLRK